MTPWLILSLLLSVPDIDAAALLPPAPSMPVQIDPAAAERALASAAAQVKRCYRSPRIASAGKRIGTKLLVRYSPDGTLVGLPVVLSQSAVTPVNVAYAGAMAEAASLAVIRCAPLRLPAELYEGGWDAFELSFTPAVPA